jgi:DNA mismatch repair protein MutS2
MRVEEAVDIVMRAVEMAHMEGAVTLEVVHGKGTGALRIAIGEYLEKSPVVKAFHIAVESMGGAGVTIVELD